MKTDFIKDKDELLFFLDWKSGREELSDYSIAFLPFQNVTGTVLSLSDTWNKKDKQGIYLFLGSAKEKIDQESFSSALHTWIDRSALSNVRFMWIKNPLDRPEFWIINFIPVSGDTQCLTGPVSYINFRSYRLSIACMGIAALNQDNDGFTLTWESNKCSFISGAGKYSPGNIGNTISIPFSGDKAGCIQFDITLIPPTGNDPLSDIDKLDIGLYYFINNRDYPVDFHFLKPWRYPVFNLKDATLTLYACLDPCFPLSPSRSNLAFFKDKTSPVPGIRTFYRTYNGDTVVLTPHNPGPGNLPPVLVFTVKPATATPVDIDPFYLAPEGDFALSVDKKTGDNSQYLLCGISGVEYIGPLNDTTIIRFKAGNNAYACPDDDATDTSPSAESGALLKGNAKTSWAYIMNTTGSSPSYYAQPENAVLYKSRNTPGSLDALEYMEVPAGDLSIPLPDSAFFPLVPYSGIKSNSLLPFYQLETRVLHNVRRKIIFSINKEYGKPGYMAGQAGYSVNSGSLKTGTTPQGLLYTFTEANVWNTLTLARFENEKGFCDLKMTGIFGPLRAAFQSNNLFLVISSRDKLLSSCSFPYEFSAQSCQDLLVYMASLLSTDLKNPKSALTPDDLYSITGFLKDLLFKLYTNESTAGLLKELEERDSTLYGKLSDTEKEIISKDYRDFQTAITCASKIKDNLYQCLPAFTTDLEKAFKATMDVFGKFRDKICEYSVIFSLDIGQWHFDLSPYKWDSHNTIMIFKYNTDMSIEELLGNSRSWTMADSFNDYVPATQQILNAIIAGIEKGNDALPEYPLPGTFKKDDFENKLLPKIRNDDEKGFIQNMYEKRDSNYVLKTKERTRLEDLRAQNILIMAGYVPAQFGQYQFENLLMNIEVDTDKRFVRTCYTLDSKEWCYSLGTGMTEDRMIRIGAILSRVWQKFADYGDFDYFMNHIIKQRYWCGIVALNCFVPLNGLPPQMEGIAAGIDVNRFYAHHIGINTTPVITGAGPGEICLQNSSLSGLIHYNDEVYLNDKDTDYMFKVFSLDVLFRNSAVIKFASKIDLMCNSLFSEPATLTSSGAGNNIIFNGYYQTHDGKPSYVFTNTKTNIFDMESKVLNQVVINKAQFVTKMTNADNEQGSYVNKISTRFQFSGYINFRELPLFDVFSFGNSEDAKDGRLSFSSLSVDMSFDDENPAYKEFSFDAGQVEFDIAASKPRGNSLYANFPLTMKRIIQAKQGDETILPGFMPVTTPLSGSKLSFPWYGLLFELNLGTPGALAGQMGFIAEILIGWSPDRDSYKVFTGLKMPGVQSGKREIDIESILKLTFGDIRFLHDGTSYILMLRNIALKLFTLTFPPNGQTDILLFGDPEGKDRNTVGWYAAYMKKEK